MAISNVCKVLLNRLVTREQVHSQEYSLQLVKVKIMTKFWHMGHISTISPSNSKSGSKSIRAKVQLRELQPFFQLTTPRVRTIWWQEQVDLCRSWLQMLSEAKTLHQLSAEHLLTVWNQLEVLAVDAGETMHKEIVAIEPHEASQEVPQGPRVKRVKDLFRGLRLSDRI